MSDLISRQDALKPFCIAPDGTRIPEVDCDNFPVEVSVQFIKKHLLSLPSADAVEVVRCKDCKYWKEGMNDLISRAAVLSELNEAYDLIDAEHRIKELVSVTPTPKRRLRLFKIIDNNTGKEPTDEVITELAKLGNLMTDDIDGFYINEDGKIILVDDCGNCTWLGMNRFDIESGEEYDT